MGLPPVVSLRVCMQPSLDENSRDWVRTFKSTPPAFAALLRPGSESRPVSDRKLHLSFTDANFIVGTSTGLVRWLSAQALW